MNNNTQNPVPGTTPNKPINPTDPVKDPITKDEEENAAKNTYSAQNKKR